ncbi:MAG: galactitol-1-phosphate 5-dehydrogenase [Candidatus Hinthialibacter antarcticus]|nr:galactitol-1-phosphate 5-dehydrogenase [Candidatus Hinthialibacter antarcticus]
MLKEYNEFEIQEISQPEPGEDEVLIAIKACGVCGSDVHGMDGSTGRRRPPIVMGHEASGVIAAVGAKVRQWKRGDRVTFDSTVYCGACWHCRRGEINLCDDRRVLGVSCEDYRRHGAFADYLAVPERIVYRLPDTISFEQAAFVEPVSIAVHAVEITPVSLNDTAVVVGAGMIGLLVIQALRAAGCGTVIAIDLDENKLQLAKSLGATIGLLANDENAIASIKEMTGGRGADVAIEAVGATAPVATAIHSVRKGGAVTLVGNLSPSIELPLQSVVTREIRLQGSCASKGEYPACLDLIASGAIQVEPLMSAVAPLSDGAEWFQRLYKKEAGLMKVILQPEQA